MKLQTHDLLNNFIILNRVIMGIQKNLPEN
jgi:hypothetical protein